MELDPAMPHHAAALVRGGGSGAVVAADRASAVKNSGEVIQSGIGAKDIFEVAQALGINHRSGSVRPQLRKVLEGRSPSVQTTQIGGIITGLSVAKAILKVAEMIGLGIILN